MPYKTYLLIEVSTYFGGRIITEHIQVLVVFLDYTSQVQMRK
jgi:hypothetical protein